MDLNEILRSQGGIGAIASQLGISEAQAQQGAAALLPSILNGFGARTASDDQSSMGGLGSILESLGGADLTRNVIAPNLRKLTRVTIFSARSLAPNR